MVYNRWRGGDPAMRGFKRFQRRSMHVVEVHLDGDAGGDGRGLTGVRLENEQELLYIGQHRDEKNWVPWEVSGVGGGAARACSRVVSRVVTCRAEQGLDGRRERGKCAAQQCPCR